MSGGVLSCHHIGYSCKMKSLIIIVVFSSVKHLDDLVNLKVVFLLKKKVCIVVVYIKSNNDPN